MRLARWSAILGTGLTAAACVAALPPDPAVLVMPGKDKTEASFQEDQSICQQHAIAHTGYGDLSQHPSGIAPEAPTPPTATSADIDDVSYMQCMAARGDIVQLTAMAGYDAGEAYAAYPYPFGYGYPDGYPFAYPYYAGIIGGFYGFGGGGFRNGGQHHAGFHGRIYGYGAGHAWGAGHGWGAGRHGSGAGHAAGAGHGGGGGGHR